MDGWMGRQLDGWMGRQLDGWIDECGWIEECGWMKNRYIDDWVAALIER